MLINKLSQHTRDIAMILADMAYFIPPEVVACVAEKNEEQFCEFEKLFEGKIDISHYLSQQSACVFPGVRRPSSSYLRGNKLKYHKEEKTILDDNRTPRHIWCFLYQNKCYTGPTWKDSGLGEFELAHLFPHKSDDNSLELVREIFHTIGDTEKFFGNFTGAGNTILLPKGSVRPTDTCREIMIVFFHRYIEMYGEQYLLGAQGFNQHMLPSWYSDLKWNKVELPNDWKARIDSLIGYRTKFIHNQLHGLSFD